MTKAKTRTNLVLSVKNITVVLIAFFLPGLQSTQAQQPNIIVFLVDDMGWMDTAVPFGEQEMPLLPERHSSG